MEQNKSHYHSVTSFNKRQLPLQNIKLGVSEKIKKINVVASKTPIRVTFWKNCTTAEKPFLLKVFWPSLIIIIYLFLLVLVVLLVN